MSEYNVVDNTELVDEVERGLRKGYWDKALIPELKKRFIELEKKEKLLELYKELITVKDELISIAWFGDAYYDKRHIEKDLEKLIKELEK